MGNVGYNVITMGFHYPNDVFLNRRSLLRTAVMAGSGGLALSELLRLRQTAAAPGTPGPDTAVIQIFLSGGPSQFETYDPKPQAPAEIRGPCSPISTNVPGIHICETMPRQARIMDKLAILRSVHHHTNKHYDGMALCHTGKRKFLEPSVGSVTAKMRGANALGIPAYVRLGNTPRKPIPTFEANHNASYLGRQYDFFKVLFDPQGKYYMPSMVLQPGLTLQRIDSRRKLVEAMDKLRRQMDNSDAFAAMDSVQQQAFEMLNGPRARQAFDLSQEPQSVRDRYGREHWSSDGREETKYHWGQATLLARRLIEAGVTFVTVDCDIRGGAFDAHQDLPRYIRETSAPMDTLVTTLVEDLHERGLDKKVLVLVWGEFGRTPVINKDAGRDHWGRVMSVALAGGGLRTGQVIGASNDRGEDPVERPLRPEDVLATVYYHLGIDPHVTFSKPDGRPVPVLYQGEPIRELL